MTKPYEAYKESKLDWLGDIPSHWDVIKLGACFTERNEKVSDKDFAALSVTKNGILPQMEHVAKTDAGDNRKKVCVGDFVINSRSDRKGSSGTSEYDGSVSLISIILEPRLYEPRFSHHLLRSYNFQEEFYKYGKGIVADLWSTRYSDMKNIVVPLIPKVEQKAIATFLDRETKRIDSLIEEKQTFIKLLKEKRLALISHVVTKGLNPNVEMKDSGIEWIGQVPKHWVVGRIGYYARVINGSTPSRSNLPYWSRKEVPWLSSGSVNQYKITHATEYISEDALKECPIELLPIGTLVMGMIGQGKTRGLSAITQIEATINQNLAAIITDSRLDSEYAHFLLEAAYNEIREFGRGGNQAALNCELISNFKITIPPVDEQKKNSW
ncbi:restriction endonuclease subunit S [Dickeya dadantii]|nr:restriction endonuclease subunit S [Dickeya dadantii]NPE64630.1 restriction endonuclease subunit S [Dickeya dadantii]